MLVSAMDDVGPEYQHVYLSPHFDDAVYSCGGTIALQTLQKEYSLVVTVFAGLPGPDLKLSSFARRIQRTMSSHQQAFSLVELRRQEDQRACSSLQADCLWLDYLDAIYRGSPALYRWKRAIGGRMRQVDAWIVEDLLHLCLALHRRLPSLHWYAPLGVGGHVDHRVVSAAAFRLLVYGANVAFYEDFPYVLHPTALKKRLQELGFMMQPQLVEISDTLALRQQAASLYASQVRINFGTAATLYQSIECYSSQISPKQGAHVERFWRPALQSDCPHPH
ncbi:MAG: PIG-L family deacetylase [Thermogemmatispora sp.]|uniref:GlcNAc-PI de-N-acetylase n=1 Tax=Thermogemmatispora aurantia TaxID=2045279 RepID=A0A5J4KG67_9CHLR|nr:MULTISPECIES: PIG-L family deacetylase [Thermogemmatispora]MBE3567375.1 PIG-L family deacetylase [Thermogemmatispora sp.]GER85281.1 GlcNAc-PI de-N-acetylase [Thermogemmatispora aurantia]